MKKNMPVLLALIYVISCSHVEPKNVTAPPVSVEKKAIFDEYQRAHSIDDVFQSDLPSTAKQALEDYNNHVRLKNGLEYGASVRKLSLSGYSAEALDHKMHDMSCARKDDVLKKSPGNEPLLDPNGKTIPLWVWLCPDGGVVRAKPMGDPTSKFRFKPHASKALRYPYDSKFENFDDEQLKVDNEGNPLPKSPKYLKPTDPTLVDAWAEDAHTYLTETSKCCCH